MDISLTYIYPSLDEKNIKILLAIDLPPKRSNYVSIFQDFFFVLNFGDVVTGFSTASKDITEQ